MSKFVREVDNLGLEQCSRKCNIILPRSRWFYCSSSIKSTKEATAVIAVAFLF
ncbi:MAG: hypothetical protein N3G21_08050 [Candidatus Hydrogenedentes bacterium]|nr:hypothetical protein [Candidatus Hydrogenedentota bacterium]